MIVMVVTCPVCASSAQAEGEGVYRQEWDHTTNPPTRCVLKQLGHRCGDCGRIYTTEYGVEVDADLIAAMQGRHPADSASGTSKAPTE